MGIMKMNKEEWEHFWERLLIQADEKDAWWLCGWLEAQKEEFEEDGVGM